MSNRRSIGCWSVGLLLLWSSLAWAELDLAPQALLQTSGTGVLMDVPLDYNQGSRNLRDGDDGTVWRSAVDRRTELLLDLSSNDATIALEIDRIELRWGDTPAQKVTVTAGPDRLTQIPIASKTITETDVSVIQPIQTLNNVRVVRIWLYPDEIDVAGISVFARDADDLGALPQLSVEAESFPLTLSWTPTPSAHHYDIERRCGDADAVIWSRTSTSESDWPREVEPCTYRVRAVDYLGMAGEWSAETVVEALPSVDDAAVAMSGVVEGFYGQPWTPRVREMIVRRIGSWGMNTYIYAPKNDEKHRSKWRELYSEEQTTHFVKLLETGRGSGVDIFFGISPGLDIDPLSDSDFNRLTAKLSQLMDLGYTNFVLLMDDIETDVTASLGSNHAALTNNLNGWLKAQNTVARLLFVPTVYIGTAGTLDADEKAYLQALRDVDSDVAFAWTGEGIFSPEIKADSVRSFKQLTEHPVWLWDNYPANDADLGLRLSLAPVAGRSAALLEELDGLLVNPMSQGIASLFALASYAELCHHPDRYDAASFGVEKLRQAIDPSLPVETYELLRDYFSTNPRLFQERDAIPEIDGKIDTLLAAFAVRNEEEIAAASSALVDDLLALVELADAFSRNMTARELSDELAMRLSLLTDLALGSLHAIHILTAQVYGVESKFVAEKKELDILLAGSLAWTYQVESADVWRRLIERVVGEDQSPFEARFTGQSPFEPIVSEPLGHARIGQTWYYDAGVNLPLQSEYSIEAAEALEAQAQSGNDFEGLVSLTPRSEEGEQSAMHPGHYWVRLSALQGYALQTQLFPIEVLPALAESEAVTLELTTELGEIDDIPVLYQNGEILSDVAFSQYNRLDLNGVWKKRRMELDHRLTFAKRDEATLALLEAESGGAVLPEYDDDDWTSIALPGVENKLCSAGFESGPEQYFGGVWYRREVPAPSGGKAARLVMLGAGYVVDVWADGRYLGYHEGPYTPIVMPLPDALADRDQITLVLRVDNPRPGTVPGMLPPTHEADWMPYAGVPRDIYWESLNTGKTAVLASVSVVPRGFSGELMIDAVVRNLVDRDIEAHLEVDIYALRAETKGYYEGADIETLLNGIYDLGGVDNHEFTLKAGGLAGASVQPVILDNLEWDPWNPRLYGVRVSLLDGNGTVLDRFITQTGLRGVDVDDSGRWLFNNQVAFLPGIARDEDSPLSGRSMTWLQIRNDLAQTKQLGGRLLRSGRYPNHPDTYVLADRLGLAAMVDIPAWWMTEADYEAETQRPLALQTWREMAFTLRNRSSIVLWGACTECQPQPDANALGGFIRSLHEDLDDNYPDGRLVTQSLDANNYDSGGGETFEEVDVIGATTYFGVLYGEDAESETLAFLEQVRDDYPNKPIMLTEFGSESAPNGEQAGRQLDVAEAVWTAVQETAQVQEDGWVQSTGFVFNATWGSLYDSYSQVSGVDSMGLYHMNRVSWKPVAERIKEMYDNYSDSLSSQADGDSLTPNTADASNCRHGSGNGAMVGLFGLALLAFLLFRRRHGQG